MLEINGVSHDEFKTVKKANQLLDTLVLDVQEVDNETYGSQEMEDLPESYSQEEEPPESDLEDESEMGSESY